MNLSAFRGLSVLAPLVAPVVLHLLQTQWYAIQLIGTTEFLCILRKQTDHFYLMLESDMPFLFSKLITNLFENKIFVSLYNEQLYLNSWSTTVFTVSSRYDFLLCCTSSNFTTVRYYFIISRATIYGDSKIYIDEY